MFPMECSFWACLISYEKVNIKLEIYTTITFYPNFFCCNIFQLSYTTVIQGRRNLLGRQGICPTSFCEIQYSLPYRFLQVAIQDVKSALPVLQSFRQLWFHHIPSFINFTNEEKSLHQEISFQRGLPSSLLEPRSCNTV